MRVEERERTERYVRRTAENAAEHAEVLRRRCLDDIRKDLAMADDLISMQVDEECLRLIVTGERDGQVYARKFTISVQVDAVERKQEVS